MAPSAISELTSQVHGPRQPSKAKLKTAHQQDESLIPLHPLGIRPLGNRLLQGQMAARDHIGSWQALPDELFELVLEGLDSRSLRSLGATCRFLFAFCYEDERWKALFLQ
jgi:hypothetical protein